MAHSLRFLVVTNGSLQWTILIGVELFCVCAMMACRKALSEVGLGPKTDLKDKLL